MKVYVLEARLKDEHGGDEDSFFVVLGTYSSEAKAKEAVDTVCENGVWCDFITKSYDLDDSSGFIQQ